MALPAPRSHALLLRFPLLHFTFPPMGSITLHGWHCAQRRCSLHADHHQNGNQRGDLRMQDLLNSVSSLDDDHHTPVLDVEGEGRLSLRGIVNLDNAL